MTISTFLLQLAIGLSSGAVAAFLTAKFALGRFYKEKWWEKRAVAFNDLVSSVYELKNVYQSELDAYYEFRDEGKENESVDWDKVELIHKDFEKLSHTGPLTLTTYAADLLKKYNKKINEINHEAINTDLEPPIAYSRIVKETSDLLEELIKHAKSELKV
ncbi:MAG: hypothetical protein ACJ8LD_10575 [Pantoea agglomerans]